MFNRNKKLLGLSLFCLAFSLLGVGYVNAATFAERLSDIGLDIKTFSNKKSISRYEVTRLLNAANCHDCIQAPDWMKQTYTQDFWNNFGSIDGKDFDDVDYEGGVRNKDSYYYCVAYVGDNNYMAGYPSTSTKCRGNFCGQEAITVSEFYQTVLNIIQGEIRDKYLINWTNVKSWKKGLKKNSIQMRVLNQSDIDVIDSVESKADYAKSNEEFQAWLKYCMYNLSDCNFQSFGIIGTGYWPVSELNVLYKEGIITAEDAQSVASFSSMKGEDAVRIFSSVYDNYASCSFNVDYDCDGITNGDDNCPYVFNANQYDLNGDGIGNVCDDDIDGDGKKNPIGIVDDNNNIVISLWDDKLDQTPLGDSNLGFSFFINVDSITTGFPTAVKFSPLTNGNIDSIERDFGDGVKQKVKGVDKVSHVFKKSGTFTVNAIANSKNGSKSFAMTKVFIATPSSERYLLNLSYSTLFKNGSVEYTFTPLYSGDFDRISRSVNDSDVQNKKVTDKFKVTVKDDGMYIVNARGFKNGELKAVAIFTVVKDGTIASSSMNIKAGYLWEETTVSVSNLVGVNIKDIDYISINRGGDITRSNNLAQSYVYDEAGLKTIQQDIVLKDGTKLYSVATVMIQNPLLTQSYAVNVTGNRLVYSQNENLALGLNMYPKTSVMSLYTDYGAGQKNFLYNPDFSKFVLDSSYLDAGDKLLTNSIEVNRCVALQNQGTVHINSVDICETAKKNKTLSNYKCDQDGDKIPDICDDDIDGDGVKNLIGLIIYENKDCSIGVENANLELLKKQLGVCSLDNCPFVINSNQSDLNNNGVGEDCELSISTLLDSYYSNNGESVTFVSYRDQDGDGVLDDLDACIDIPGNSYDGCPKIHSQNCWVYSSCGNGQIDEGENCKNCPEDVGLCCGNGILDSWETCKTCPADAGMCNKCGNEKIDEGENCRNCPEDVGECTAYCGNGKIEAIENCRNCEKDVGKCSATCGDGEIQPAEDCKNCSKDVGVCRSETCGNGVVEEGAGEKCDNGENNGKDGKCTKMCTKYDEKNPKCGNGEIDEGEDCKTCPVDLGEKCVADGDKQGRCGDKKIDANENCRNCEKDVGKCSATCGDGEIQPAEDCKNCSKDVGVCRSETCGNGVVEEGAGEKCDNGENNGKDGKCTKMCTKYDEKNPKCGNGEIDEGEDCKTCPVDLGEKCVADGSKKGQCGNGQIDEGENCKNCPEDVGECTAYCGNGKIEAAEDCRNCEKDVGKCSATCGDGEIQPAEDCKNCSKDVGVCRSETCGNGVVEEGAGEKCDNGENNGKDGKCTKMCTKYDEKNPKCGNGEIDEGEDCDTCSVDLGEKCVANGDKKKNLCGNGVLDDGEQCDYEDNTQKDWGTKGCSNSCQKLDKDSGECNPKYDGQVVKGVLNEAPDLCLKGVVKTFRVLNFQWSWLCVDENTHNSVKCLVDKSSCGDGLIGVDEKCYNCSSDLKDVCVDDGEDDSDPNCKCDECPEMRKDICVDDGENDPDSNCKCDECPEKRKDACVDDGEDEGEDEGDDDSDSNCKCDECPEKRGDDCIKPYNPDAPDNINPDNPDDSEDPEVPDNLENPNNPNISDDEWHLESDNCNVCPCEYVDFSTELARGDTIRAKLWDKAFPVFYRYSNFVSVENYIDFEGSHGELWNKNIGEGGSKNNLVVRMSDGDVVREYSVMDQVEASESKKVMEEFKNIIKSGGKKNSLRGDLYLDSNTFKKGLNLIKDDPSFMITVGVVDGKEYSLLVKNKVNNEVTRAMILQDENEEFETYCKNVLSMNLSILGTVLSETQDKGKKNVSEEPKSEVNKNLTEKEECNFTSKERELGCLYSVDEWCSKDGVSYYKTPCSACDVGYNLKDGKCVANICSEEYWLDERYTSHYEGTARQIAYGEAKFVVDMMPNCQQMDSCERPAKNDNARFGGIKYNFYDGGAYYACTKCNSGYELIKGRCIAKSGIGSIYKRNGKPIGVVFYEDNNVIKVVSFYNVDVNSKEIPVAATDYFYSDSINPMLSSDDRVELGKKLTSAGITRDSVRVNWNDGNKSADIKALEKITSQEDAKKDMDGFSNTAKILAEQPNFQAAKACYNYEPEACKGDVVCGKGKWYLPALGELWQLCLNYKEAGPVLQALNLFDVESVDIGPLSSTMNGNKIMIEGVVKNYSVWSLDIEFGCSDTWIEKQGGKITTSPQTIDPEREKGVRPVLTIKKGK